MRGSTLTSPAIERVLWPATNTIRARYTSRRARRPASRLAQLAYLRLEPSFSCFGNYPDLESPITYEK
jgi:hypothetical protein